MNCVRMNCKSPDVDDGVVDNDEQWTYSFSNYNWNVQPANAIYQDSENCSHEENKYRFNFVRTTLTAGVDDMQLPSRCLLLFFVFFCSFAFVYIFFSFLFGFICSVLCVYLHFVCKWKTSIRTYIYSVMFARHCLQLHAISVGIMRLYETLSIHTGWWLVAFILFLLARFITKLARQMFLWKKKKKLNWVELKGGIHIGRRRKRRIKRTTRGAISLSSYDNKS